MSRQKKFKVDVERKRNDFEVEWTYFIVLMVENDPISNQFIRTLNDTEITDSRIRIIKKKDVTDFMKSNKEVNKSPSEQINLKKPQKAGPRKSLRGLKNDKENCSKTSTDSFVSLSSNSVAKIVEQFINKLKIDVLSKSSRDNKTTVDRGKTRTTTESGLKKKTAVDGKKDQNAAVDASQETKLPQCLILTGFYDPFLPLEMVRLNLPVRAIVELKDTSRFEEDSSPKIEPPLSDKTDPSDLTSDNFNFLFLKFWARFRRDNFTLEISDEDIAEINIDLPDGIALIISKVMEKRGKQETAAIKQKLKLAINKLLTKFTSHFLSSIEKHSQKMACVEQYDLSPNFQPLENAKHYLQLSHMLPEDNSEIFFILHSMIEQVSIWHDHKSESISHPRCSSDTKFIVNRQNIINHRNTIELKYFHLCSHSVNTLNCLLRKYITSMPVFHPWKAIGKKTKKQKSLGKFHLKRLWKLRNDTEIDQNLYDLYLHWFILCRMKLGYISQFTKKMKGCATHRSSRNYLKKDSVNSNQGKSIKKERIEKRKYNRFSCMSVKSMIKLRRKNMRMLKKFIEIPQIVELVQSDKQVDHLMSFDDALYKYSEEMSPECLLQTVVELDSIFLKCDSYHFPPSDKILIWFHNDIGTNSKTNKFGIETYLGFRDFYKKNMKGESNKVSNLNEDSADITKESSKKSFDNKSRTKKNSGDKVEKTLKSNTADNKDESNKDDSSMIRKGKLYNLWGSEVELEYSTKSFVSADSSTVVVEIDNWMNKSKNMRISFKKMNTELIYHKALSTTSDENEYEENGRDEESIYSNAVVNLPDGSRISVAIEEKYLPDRFLKLFYTFHITLPSGLSIEVVKDREDYYVKQKYFFGSLLTESIENEKCRCFLKSGEVIVFYKHGKIKVMYSNGTIVQINDIVNVSDVTASGTSNPFLSKRFSMDKSLSGDRNVSGKRLSGTEEFSQDDESSINNKKQMSQLERLKKLNSFRVEKQLITTSYGENYSYNDGNYKSRKSYSVRTIFDPNKTLYIQRSDGYKALYADDCSLFSTFPDRTRIATLSDIEYKKYDPENDNNNLACSFVGVYSRDSARRSLGNFVEDGADIPDFEDEFLVYKLITLAEHPLYARVEYNLQQCAIRLTLPGGVIVHVLENLNDFIVDVDSKTKLIFSKENIVFTSGLIKETNRENVTIINSISKTIDLSKTVTKPPFYCKTIDSFGKTFTIDSNGVAEFSNESCSEDTIYNLFGITEKLGTKYYYEKTIPKNKFDRFLIVSPDFSGHELLHKSDLETYLLDLKKEKKKISVSMNPTCGKLKSKTIQYPLFEAYYERFLIPYTNIENLYFPEHFTKSALGKPWKLKESLWLFKETGQLEQQIFYHEKRPERIKKPIAVVYRTVDEICHKEDKKLIEVAISLLRYKVRNKKLLRMYSKNGVKTKKTAHEPKDELTEDDSKPRDNFFTNNPSYQFDISSKESINLFQKNNSLKNTSSVEDNSLNKYSSVDYNFKEV